MKSDEAIQYLEKQILGHNFGERTHEAVAKLLVDRKLLEADLRDAKLALRALGGPDAELLMRVAQEYKERAAKIAEQIEAAQGVGEV